MGSVQVDVRWGTSRLLMSAGWTVPIATQEFMSLVAPCPTSALVAVFDLPRAVQGSLFLFLFPKRQGLPHLSLPPFCRLRRQIYRCNLRNNRPRPAFPAHQHFPLQLLG